MPFFRNFKGNKPLAREYFITKAGIGLFCALDIANRVFKVNKQHYLFERIYLKELEIAKIINDKERLIKYTSLLETYRSEPIVEPTMPVASPDTKLEPTFIKPSQEQMQKIQQKHKRH